MKQRSVISTPTLPEVQSRFAQWRKTKNHRDRIPEDLWAAAVMLSQKHAIYKVAKVLGLSYTQLKKRVLSNKPLQTCSEGPSHEFIPIDIPPVNSAECIIEMEHHNGNKVRMHFKGKADLDLQAFSESFWSGKV